MKPIETFQKWLETEIPPWRMGQVVLLPGYFIRHENDVASTSSLRPIANLQEWLNLIRFNREGQFRPLKAAPDLVSGWHYGPLSFADLIIALRYLYPAAIANWNYFKMGHLPITSYHQTADRQTGRFAIVKTLSEEQQQELIETVCAQGCLKRRLWYPNDERINLSEIQLSEIPILCPEACNFFISKARAYLKGSEE